MISFLNDVHGAGNCQDPDEKQQQKKKVIKWKMLSF